MEQLDLVRRAVDLLEGLGAAYMLVGSYGSATWGEARFTQDIDIVVQLGWGDVEPLVAAFPLPDYYVSVEAVRDAIRRGGQFNVVHSASGNKIDFMIARQTAWGRTQLERRRAIALTEDLSVYVAAPEDIILGKLLYYKVGGSEKHLRDIAGVMRVNGQMVDGEYVHRWARALGVLEVWEAIQRRLNAGS